MRPVCFSQIIGNEHIKRQLQRMVAKRAIGHALLFAGPDGIGKSLFAYALAAQIMKEFDPNQDHPGKIAADLHPDVHAYLPEGKLGLHSIQALRELSEEVHLPPFEAGWKVFIIHEADRMLSYSANALLKTFEEPPPRTLIILLTRSASALLPTILSRCSSLHFQSVSDPLIRNFLTDNYNLDEARAATIVREAQGSPGRAVQLASQAQGDEIRTATLKLLAQGKFIDFKSMQKWTNEIGDHIENAKKLAEDKTKEEVYKLSAEHLSARQQAALEKELEGLTALAMSRQAQGVFGCILSWYRDLQLLMLDGSSSYLSNPEFKAELEQALQRGEYKPIDEVCRAVEEAFLALQRSTSLSICLENLFLTLDRI